MIPTSGLPGGRGRGQRPRGVSSSSRESVVGGRAGATAGGRGPDTERPHSTALVAVLHRLCLWAGKGLGQGPAALRGPGSPGGARPCFPVATSRSCSPGGGCGLRSRASPASGLTPPGPSSQPQSIAGAARVGPDGLRPSGPCPVLPPPGCRPHSDWWPGVASPSL